MVELCPSAGWAEAPLAIAAPRKARTRIVDEARAWLGTPYRYGGMSREGVDCSGLVYSVYIGCFGSVPTTGLPRTATRLFSFVEAIPDKELEPGDLVFFNTTGKLSHVGIYEGDGLFIHAASDGPNTGVIESGLGEKYWAAHYAGAGRLIPPAGYLGLILTASLGPTLGTGLDFRGIDAACELSYRLGNLEAGLELRPSWDAGLSVFRLPLVLSISLDRQLRFFAGPALTLGEPSMGAGGVSTSFSAEGGWLATAGLVYTPFRFRLPGGAEAGLYLDLVYDRYVALPPAGLADELVAQVRAGAGLRMRYGF
jgi:probable lipoprotein NlpC